MSLILKNLHAAYDKTPVIENLSATANTGDFIALVGPNGAGKSCLLKTIAGILTPMQGTLSLGGAPLLTMPVKSRARQIAYLAQERTAAWTLSVRDLVALGRAPYRGPLGRLSQDGEAAVERAMRTAQCSELSGRRFDRLSGGEQARVHLARALAVNAPVLLADEPAASLDPYYQITIMKSLSAEAASGKTVIASLHDLRLARQFASRIWVLNAGEIVKDASPDTAFTARLLSDVFHVSPDDSGLFAT